MIFCQVPWDKSSGRDIEGDRDFNINLLFSRIYTPTLVCRTENQVFVLNLFLN